MNHECPKHSGGHRWRDLKRKLFEQLPHRDVPDKSPPGPHRQTYPNLRPIEGISSRKRLRFREMVTTGTAARPAAFQIRPVGREFDARAAFDRSAAITAHTRIRDIRPHPGSGREAS